MTDTLSRLAGPTSPSRSDAGSTIYDPSSGTIAVKNAIFTNRDPLKGAWVTLSVNTLATKSNIIVPDLFVPPSSTVPVELDLVMDGTTDDIRARQVVDMSYTRSLVPATAVAVINSTTDGTTFATAGYAGIASRAYLMFVLATHATAAAAPTSFTDTHDGCTWTQVGNTITNTLGIGAGSPTMALSAWRCQMTGTTNTTTTANFGATMTGCHIVVLTVPGADVTGTHGSEAFQAGGEFCFTTVTGTSIVLPGTNMCGARIAAFSSNAGSTSTAGAGFTELSDAAIATPTNMLTTEYANTPGAVADITLATTSTDKIGMLVSVQDGSTPVNVTLNGVVVT